jgi:hypothetical protein
MASTKPGERKHQILQTLAAMLENPKGEKSPPQPCGKRWRCLKGRFISSFRQQSADV